MTHLETLRHLFELESKGRIADALDEARRLDVAAGTTGSVSAFNLKLFLDRLHRKSASPTPVVAGAAAAGESRLSGPDQAYTWTAFITLWKRRDYLAEQLAALRGARVPPVEIIILINEGHLSEQDVRAVAGDCKVLTSDLNSLYSRWALAYDAAGEYVAVFDNDTVPGAWWMDNAVRASRQYGAVVGSAGRVHDPAGLHGFYELVVPAGRSQPHHTRDCSLSDQYCDWLCNSYVFRRDWVAHILAEPRFENAQRTFDDIQLATSLWKAAGIPAVVPVQPAHERRLHGSLKAEYGNDTAALWRTNSAHHFAERRRYIESRIADGYVPVRDRPDLIRFHLIVPFGERPYLERCLLSIKGQTHRNYTVTLIDDCDDPGDQAELVATLDFGTTTVRYLRAERKLYGLRAREIATDNLEAGLADVVVHLDGDDWLAHPHALARLAAEYASGDVHATYGNGFSYFPDKEAKGYWCFWELQMARKWGFGKSPQSDTREHAYRAITAEEAGDDWRDAPWGAMHLRTFRYSAWCAISRDHFIADGRYLQVATDAAILLPVLNHVGFERVRFIDDLLYGYRNGSNTVHSRGQTRHGEGERSRDCIRRARFVEQQAAVVSEARFGPRRVQDDDPRIRDDARWLPVAPNLQTSRSLASRPLVLDKPAPMGPADTLALVTVVTPNYLADGLIAVLTVAANMACRKSLHIFLASRDATQIGHAEAICAVAGVRLLTPQTLSHTADQSATLERAYGFDTDEYRWGMKAVVLMELLHGGAATSLFLDPDTYAVSPMDDLLTAIRARGLSVFPHFRDPEDEYLRKVLYRDGFFNGGMIAATRSGLRELARLYVRCAREMKKDPDRNRWDDQKYLDLCALESNDVMVNTDRGIDYNPWNYEPVEGLVGPSQRSYLLRSGYFVRHWHVSTNMIKQTVENHPRHRVYKPVVATYLATLSLMLLALPLVARRPELWREFGLDARIEKTDATLSKLVTGGPTVHALRELGTRCRQARDAASCRDALQAVVDLVQSTPALENLALFEHLRRGLAAQLGDTPAADPAPLAPLIDRAHAVRQAQRCLGWTPPKADVPSAAPTVPPLSRQLGIFRDAQLTFV